MQLQYIYVMLGAIYKITFDFIIIGIIEEILQFQISHEELLH